MAAETHDFDLAGLRLGAGEGRRLTLDVPIEPLLLGGERYAAAPADQSSAKSVPVELEISRMVGGGYALRLRFEAALEGPCMRCLKQAGPIVRVQSREVDTLKGAPSGAQAGRPGEGEEMDSPYVHDETLDLAAWARDAFALAMPVKVLCREDCAGLCPVCAADLNEEGPEHHHEPAPDPRWAKLRELKLE
jgi:uncharacterized protein